MIKDDDFLIIKEYTENIKGDLYKIQEARMRSRYDNPGNLYGDTFKFYTKLTFNNNDIKMFMDIEDLWTRRQNLWPDGVKIGDEQERLYYVWDKRSIINQVIYMWSNEVNKCIFPSKLYLAAIVYAKVLSDWSGLDFYDILSDRNLLENDKDWKSYLEDKDTYDQILSSINLDTIYSLEGMPKYSVEYCKKEFNL
jgi:hypothetical protein